MIETVRRWDRGWARFEGWLTVGVLILMVLVAGFAAGVRNLTRFDIQWASVLLADIEWADSLLRKGTLWLAFLGCSLATYHKKHIIIDPLLRLAPPKAKYSLLSFAMLVAGVLTVLVTYSFWSAVELNLTERPIEFELLDEDGRSIHVCDATDAQVEALQDFDKPDIFCASRAVLAMIGIPAETPGAAFQLIVPVMFFVTALRMFGHGIGYGAVVLGGDQAIAEAEAAEQRAVEAQQASLLTEDELDKSS